MKITPMPQFEGSAGRYFVSREVLTLVDRLATDPKAGKAVPGTAGLMRRIRHPYALRQSERGFYPVVVYLINDAENEIILVDVIDGSDEFKAMMSDPWTWAKAVNVVRLLQALWDQVQ